MKDEAAVGQATEMVSCAERLRFHMVAAPFSDDSATGSGCRLSDAVQSAAMRCRTGGKPWKAGRRFAKFLHYRNSK